MIIKWSSCLRDLFAFQRIIFIGVVINVTHKREEKSPGTLLYMTNVCYKAKADCNESAFLPCHTCKSDCRTYRREALNYGAFETKVSFTFGCMRVIVFAHVTFVNMWMTPTSAWLVVVLVFHRHTHGSLTRTIHNRTNCERRIKMAHGMHKHAHFLYSCDLKYVSTCISIQLKLRPSDTGKIHNTKWYKQKVRRIVI